MMIDMLALISVAATLLTAVEAQTADGTYNKDDNNR